jgi:hypothetical protein
MILAPLCEREREKEKEKRERSYYKRLESVLSIV